MLIALAAIGLIGLALFACPICGAHWGTQAEANKCRDFHR